MVHRAEGDHRPREGDPVVRHEGRESAIDRRKLRFGEAEEGFVVGENDTGGRHHPRDDSREQNAAPEQRDPGPAEREPARRGKWIGCR